MKTLLVCLTLSLPCVATARIGESPALCILRYGDPASVGQDNQSLLFKKNGILIGCMFHEGVCDRITYCHSDANAIGISDPLTDTEIETLLGAASSGKPWKKMEVSSPDRYWATEGNGMTGCYRFQDHMLLVMTDAALKRVNQRRPEAAEEKKTADPPSEKEPGRASPEGGAKKGESQRPAEPSAQEKEKKPSPSDEEPPRKPKQLQGEAEKPANPDLEAGAPPRPKRPQP